MDTEIIPTFWELKYLTFLPRYKTQSERQAEWDAVFERHFPLIRPEHHVGDFAIGTPYSFCIWYIQGRFFWSPEGAFPHQFRRTTIEEVLQLVGAVV